MVIFKSKRLTYLTLAVALLILLVFIAPALRTGVVTVLRRPLVLFTWVRQELSAAIFFHRNYYESRRYREENEVLRTRLFRLEEVRRENERLRELLVFKRHSDRILLAARVLSRSRDSWANALVIDKGTADGVKEGMGVITRGGFVGRVVEVHQSYSKLLLISDPNLGVSAMCQRSRQQGLVSGTLGSTLIMRYLPDEPDLREGDVIMTSGLATTYPKGLLIGVVLSVQQDLSGLSYHAVIKPAVDLTTLEEVLVIIG